MRKEHYDYSADAAVVAPLMAAGVGQNEAARRLGWTRYRTREAYGQAGPRPEAAVQPGSLRQLSQRSRHIEEIDGRQPLGKVHRYIVGWADPTLPENFVENLFAYASDIGATFLLGGNPDLIDQYPADLRPYVCTDRVRLADSLLFIGSPGHGGSAATPLDRYTTQNHGQHVIVPHAQVALRTIPRMACHPARFAVSTGAVTVPDYGGKVADQMALWHHTAAALLVEIDVDGEVFMRHLIADASGAFQDLDAYVSDGRVRYGEAVDGIVWGDVHHQVMSWPVGLASFGYDRASRKRVRSYNLLDLTRPRWQVMSDVYNHTWRHKMNKGNATELARMHWLGQGDVRQEVRETAEFINLCRRPGCDLRLIEDNHGAKLVSWVDADGRKDPLPENSIYWAELFARRGKMIKANPSGFRPYELVEAALRGEGLADDVTVVYRGESFAPGGIETAIHSHKGINGSSGNPRQFKSFGSRITVTHPHSPLYDEGLVVVGTCAEIPEAWDPDSTTHAHAHAVHYRTGKRALICMSADGRFRAMGDVRR